VISVSYLACRVRAYVCSRTCRVLSSLRLSKQKSPAREMGARGPFCTAAIQGGACRLGVKNEKFAPLQVMSASRQGFPLRFRAPQLRVFRKGNGSWLFRSMGLFASLVLCPLQPATPSLPATSSSSLDRKTFSACVPLSFRQHRRRAQIPIALLPHQSPAAALVHYLPTRFRALALFGRRSPERVVRSSLPAAENLHITGLMHRSKRRITRLKSMWGCG
jgi:hypothetical protein